MLVAVGCADESCPPPAEPDTEPDAGVALDAGEALDADPADAGRAPDARRTIGSEAERAPEAMSPQR